MVDISTIVTAVTSLTGLAILAEATTETIKTVMPTNLSENGTKLIAAGVGVALAATLDVSVLGTSTPLTHYVGIFLAGLVASRGSNYVHTLADMLLTAKDNMLSKK